MLSFTRKTSQVILNVPGPLGLWFPLTFEAGTEWAAELLLDFINHGIEKRIENVRRLEYEAGWKDAKAKKRPKRTWFLSTLHELA